MSVIWNGFRKWRALIKGVAMLHVYALGFLVIFFARVPGAKISETSGSYNKGILSSIFSPKSAHASTLTIRSPLFTYVNSDGLTVDSSIHYSYVSFSNYAALTQVINNNEPLPGTLNTVTSYSNPNYVG